MAGGKRVSYYYDPDIGNFYYGQVTPFATGASPPPNAQAAAAAAREPGRRESRRGELCLLLLRAARLARCGLAAPLARCARSV